MKVKGSVTVSRKPDMSMVCREVVAAILGCTHSSYILISIRLSTKPDSVSFKGYSHIAVFSKFVCTRFAFIVDLQLHSPHT